MALTYLGDEREREVLSTVDVVVAAEAKRLGLRVNDLERSIAYLWERRQQKAADEWRDYLSSHEIGPFGGR